MKYSIVVPVLDEEENVDALYDQLCAVLVDRQDWELIFVDDGSQDSTFAKLENIAAKDKSVKVLRLRRNFGQTAAMMAGFDAASGDVILPMDGDLQNDPADIPRLVEKLNEGYDVVSGWRKNRQDKAFSRKLPSLLANKLISFFTGVALHDYGCTLKAYRREIIEEVRIYGEMHRFVPALAHQVGARVAELEVNHRARVAGTSKYGIDRIFRVLLDLMTVKFFQTYSLRPMHLFGQWGGVAFLGSFLSGAVTLYMKFFDALPMNRNPLLILSAFLLFSGIQLFALGLVAELMTRTYHESQRKRTYSVRQTLNLTQDLLN